MDNIQIEQKRAELQVKLTILKENYTNLKHQFEESNASLAVILQKSRQSNKLIETKSIQIESLKSEVQKESSSLNELKSYCNTLIKEKENSESEITYYNQQYAILQATNDELKAKLYNMSIHQDKYSKSNKNKPIALQDTLHTTQIQNASADERVKVLQSQIHLLNEDISTFEHQDEYDNDDMNSYYDNKIKALINEIDYIDRSITVNKEKNKKCEKELKELSSIIFNLNKINIQINAGLNIIQGSLNKKAAYLLNDKDYFDACLKTKDNIINNLQDATVYNNNN